MESKKIWAVGLAAVTEKDGTVLDIWYPRGHEGEIDEAQAAWEAEKLRIQEGVDKARGVINKVMTVFIDTDCDPVSAEDVYLRLHSLSWRMMKPNTVNLEGMFDHLQMVVWTNHGSCAYEDFEETRLRLMNKFDKGINARSVDRIPQMLGFVSPSGVRISNAETVRLGAYLASGTVVGYNGFVNYNAGALGKCHVEGRISQGVTIDEGTSLAGGASTAGSLAIGMHRKVSLGKKCHMGSNSGLAIPLGDNCVVEAGLYLNGDTKVYYMPSGGVMPGDTGFFVEPRTMVAEELAGVSNALFRRNSQSGRVEAVSREGRHIELEYTD